MDINFTQTIKNEIEQAFNQATDTFSSQINLVQALVNAVLFCAAKDPNSEEVKYYQSLLGDRLKQIKAGLDREIQSKASELARESENETIKLYLSQLIYESGCFAQYAQRLSKLLSEPEDLKKQPGQKESSTETPFFARLLEDQNRFPKTHERTLSGSVTQKPPSDLEDSGAVTLKSPSDEEDNGVVTKKLPFDGEYTGMDTDKYPSDLEDSAGGTQKYLSYQEDGGQFTLKYPSDEEDSGGVTKKYPSDAEDFGFVVQKYPSAQELAAMPRSNILLMKRIVVA